MLLCTDLHAANVLVAERQPWLVIDPKPHVGDPAYDPLQHMLNCGERLRADPLDLVRRLAGLLDLDHERLRLWLFARCVQESPDWPGLAEVARRIAPGRPAPLLRRCACRSMLRPIGTVAAATDVRRWSR